jgi:uncharacterized protein (TIGR02145 family)
LTLSYLSNHRETKKIELINNLMKRVALTAAIMLGYLLPMAQEQGITLKNYPATAFNKAELTKPRDKPADNLILNSIINLTDKEGNSYNVIQIGNQSWMAENLKATKFNDGTMIPFVSEYQVWSTLTSPGYCWYSNDKGKYEIDYGALYNWYTVNTGKLCPTGWHVPSVEEWMVLIEHVDKNNNGGKLKESGRQYWMIPNTGATNATGFTALPGGNRGSRGSFFDKRFHGYWWSSTEVDINNARYYSLGYNSNEATGNSDYKKSGLSIRCVKD